MMLMDTAPWGILGQGKFKTPEELKSRAQLRGGAQPSDGEIKLCEVLQEVATEIGGGAHLAGGKPLVGVTRTLLTSSSGNGVGQRHHD
jgi:hypothetical protein